MLQAQAKVIANQKNHCLSLQLLHLLFHLTFQSIYTFSKITTLLRINQIIVWLVLSFQFCFCGLKFIIFPLFLGKFHSSFFQPAHPWTFLFVEEKFQKLQWTNSKNWNYVVIWVTKYYYDELKVIQVVVESDCKDNRLFNGVSTTTDKETPNVSTIGRLLKAYS